MSAADSLGAPVVRVDARDKVTGAARYAFEHDLPGQLYAWIITATIAAGRVMDIDREHVLAQPGVVALLAHDNAPVLHDAGDAELLLLQSDVVAYRGQVVGLVVAETLDQAREAAERARVRYEEHEAELVHDPAHPDLYGPVTTNAGFATDSVRGDLESAWRQATHRVDVEYRTSAAFNSPMEPHATVADWTGDRLELVDSLQGSNWAQGTLATVLGIPVEQIRIRVPHVGGGFGSKGPLRPNSVLVALASRMTGRPVKIVVSRQMMFALTGHRQPTISRLRLGADAEGRLSALGHDAVGLVSRIQEFAEQTAVPTRHMYAAEHRRTTHRLARLHVPTPSFMRGPGETPGMYALESAMDELATELDMDPIALRIVNEPELDPEEGVPWGTRRLVDCLRHGAELFGWHERDRRPGLHREGRELVGTGVASALYPADTWISDAAITARVDGTFLVELNATDIGTGARTVLPQIAASELGVGIERIELRMGDTDLPPAPVAGGSFGTSSWAWAIAKAARELLPQLPPSGELREDLRVVVNTAADIEARPHRSRFAFGAQFVEARVDLDTGQVRVPRMLGVFSAGRILNPRTARSQLVGGMIMGLSMALHEHAAIEPERGGYTARDFASYHFAANADVGEVRAEWLEEPDTDINPVGAKGVGEIGMVGIAAAVTNAVWHATGVRVRHAPILPDALLGRLPRD